MPSTRIETGAGWIGHRHFDVIDAVQTALEDVLGIPDWDRDVVLTEHPIDKRIVPTGRSEKFTRIEIVLQPNLDELPDLSALESESE